MKGINHTPLMDLTLNYFLFILNILNLFIVITLITSHQYKERYKYDSMELNKYYLKVNTL